jgi:hypothetical protein
MAQPGPAMDYGFRIDRGYSWLFFKTSGFHA